MEFFQQIPLYQNSRGKKGVYSGMKGCFYPSRTYDRYIPASLVTYI